jgi:predicted AAA+ superfamily ATPase
MKTIISKIGLNILFKFVPQLIVNLFDHYDAKLIEFVDSTEYELDNKIYTALKAFVDALR